jgi:pimeloyl-ACP methyl ester carboxylesterase
LIDAFGSLGDGRDWEVWVVEYPGYGGRAGTPGKEAFIRAGREALDQLRAADRRPIHLLGESIGSGTASALAGELRSGIAGLLLLVPFARLEEVAREKFPYLPVRLLLRDKFDNVAALADFTGPAVFVVATRDEVVGADQGRKLAQSYRGPGLLVELPGAGHNDHRAGPTAEWVVRGSAFLLGRTP